MNFFSFWVAASRGAFSQAWHWSKFVHVLMVLITGIAVLFSVHLHEYAITVAIPLTVMIAVFFIGLFQQAFSMYRQEYEKRIEAEKQSEDNDATLKQEAADNEAKIRKEYGRNDAKSFLNAVTNWRGLCSEWHGRTPRDLACYKLSAHNVGEPGAVMFATAAELARLIIHDISAHGPNTVRFLDQQGIDSRLVSEWISSQENAQRDHQAKDAVDDLRSTIEDALMRTA